MTDRRNGYRAPRRCPVCFSQRGLERARRSGQRRPRLQPLQVPLPESIRELDDDASRCAACCARSTPPAEVARGSRTRDAAREKTSQRRLAALRKQLAPRARVLEIGVRDGSFGLAAVARVRIRRHRLTRAGRARRARARPRGLLRDARELRQHRSGVRRHRALSRLREHGRSARRAGAHQGPAQAGRRAVPDDVRHRGAALSVHRAASGWRRTSART